MRGIPNLPPRYQFISEIGAGGMGAVVLVFDTELEREVALKLIKPGRANEIALQRFVNEAKITSQLEHPTIMPVHDAGTLPDGSYWYAMKRVAGESLKDSLRTGFTRFPLDARIEVLERLCDALAYVHAQHVIHRDLKPDNIMLGAHGEVVLMDFGLAKKLDHEADSESASIMDVEDLQSEQGLTMEGKIMGTPAYMPPEQARGQISMLGPWSDIWALGAILYEMLTGEAPYKARDVMDILRLARKGRVEDPRMRGRRTGAPEIPPELVSIVLKATAFHPNRRYRTADALGRDLAAWRKFDPVSAHRDTAMQKVSRFVRKNPGRTATMSAAALFALGVSAIAAFAASAVSQAEVEKAQLAERETAARAEADQQRVRAALQEGKLETLAKDLGVGLKRSGLKALDKLNDLIDRDKQQGGLGEGALSSFTNAQLEEVLGEFGRARRAEQETGTQIVTGRDYAALGQLYLRGLKQPMRAIAAFEEALRRDTSLNADWITLARMGQAWAVAAQDDKAVPWLQRAVAHLPSASADRRVEATITTLAMCLHRLGQFDEAVRYYERGIALMPPDDPGMPQWKAWLQAARDQRK